MTNNEFVSEISGILKSVNRDNRIPRRLILRVAQETATELISQKLMDRTISSETNLFTRIECLEFEKVESKSCPSLEFRMCKTLMKSKKPLPKLVFSRLGASIKDIIALDGEFLFTFVDESQYRRNKKRQHQIKNQVFVYLGNDNHLYIPDREIFSVDLVALTVDTVGAANCSECKEVDCLSNWQYPFIVPDKLVKTVKDLTLQTLGITRQAVEDQQPNSIENG